jgi:hypothetical protein|tara:strand:- start:459 stop:704 length:246 start_codon:yes stop_codon:yes gene_type:complete
MKEFQDKFMTQSKFSSLVEDVVKNSNGLVNYIDAVVVVCDEYEIEVETVNKLISRPLKDKIKYNAQQLNYVKKTSRGVLPL